MAQRFFVKLQEMTFTVLEANLAREIESLAKIYLKFNDTENLPPAAEECNANGLGVQARSNRLFRQREKSTMRETHVPISAKG